MDLIRQYVQKIEQNNIVSKTDIDGVITFVSDAFCKISGYSREELIGNTHNLVRHPDVPVETFEKMWKTILKKQTYKSTVKNLSKSGETFYLNTTIFSLLDKDENIVEFAAIRYDVTEAVKATHELKRKDKELQELNTTLEEKVKKQTKELVELNRNLKKRIQKEVEKSSKRERIMHSQARLASMGEMIGNIAHQWRQPLNNLNIVLYKMKKEFNKNKDEFEKNYKDAKYLTKDMSNTIDDFRNFFQPDKKVEIFYINEAIKQTYLLLEKTLENEKIKMLFDMPQEYKIEGYPNEFSHVLLNIINNARDVLKNKDGEKSILVKTQYVKKKGLKEFIMIFIEDNGGGIDEENMDKIFEPYFTTKHKSSGTGIGLYMCKQIIESSMQGKIDVKNKKEGACFVIEIPYKG